MERDTYPINSVPYHLFQSDDTAGSGKAADSVLGGDQTASFEQLEEIPLDSPSRPPFSETPLGEITNKSSLYSQAFDSSTSKLEESPFSSTFDETLQTTAVELSPSEQIEELKLMLSDTQFALQNLTAENKSLRDQGNN